MVESRRGLWWKLSVAVGLISQRGQVLRTVDIVEYPARPLHVACHDMETIAKSQLKMLWPEDKVSIIANGAEVASVLFQFALTPEMYHE